jgi:ABC-type transport system involved in cytochrome bd biosynthesis fused ATPase/permease subunit
LILNATFLRSCAIDLLCYLGIALSIVFTCLSIAIVARVLLRMRDPVADWMQRQTPN